MLPKGSTYSIGGRRKKIVDFKESRRFENIMRNAKALKERIAQQKSDDFSVSDVKFFKEKDKQLKQLENITKDEQKQYLEE